MFTLPDNGQPLVPPVIPEGYGRLPHEEEVAARTAYANAMLQNLTFQQRKFVAAYLASFDPVKAAQEAGIEGEQQAKAQGRKWLKAPYIIDAVQKGLAYYQSTCALRFDDLIKELRLIVFTSIRDFLDEEGVPDITKVPPNDPRWRAVKKWGFRPTKYGDAIAIEMNDNLSAIEKLMKILQPALADGKPDGEGKEQNPVNVTVQSVNVIPVPQGQYIPPPPAPDMAQLAAPVKIVDVTPNR